MPNDCANAPGGAATSMRIMLADRDLLFRQGVKALLERHSCEVVAGLDGLQAVDHTHMSS
jgi:DNA-binding NarL/FixJ family response regulator